jgi:phosphoserine phosphatase RsbU/P
MFCCKYDGVTRTLSYANAGHTRPILLRDGSWIELDTDGLILGVERDVLFEEKSVPLKAGDLIFIYTDGIIEAEGESGELFGVERLYPLLLGLMQEEPKIIIEKVMAEVTAFVTPLPLQDDTSMVVMKVGVT